MKVHLVEDVWQLGYTNQVVVERVPLLKPTRPMTHDKGVRRSKYSKHMQKFPPTRNY